MKLFKNKKTINKDKIQRLKNIDINNNRVNAYYTASKKQLDAFDRNSRLERPDLQKKSKYNLLTIFKYILIILIIILIFFGIFVLYGTPRVQLLGGSPYRTMQEYESISRSAIDDSLVNRFKPTLKTEQIEQKIKESVPEAINVNIETRPFGGSPEVSILVAPGFSVFNQPEDQPTVLTNRGRLAVDVKNTILDTGALSVIDNQSEYNYKIGDQVFKPTEMDALKEIQFQFNKVGETKLKYVLPQKPREIWVEYKGYKIIFGLDVGAPIQIQFGAFKAIESEIEQGRQAPPSEYIDVRLGDKVFIK